VSDAHTAHLLLAYAGHLSPPVEKSVACAFKWWHSTTEQSSRDVSEDNARAPLRNGLRTRRFVEEYWEDDPDFGRGTMMERGKYIGQRVDDPTKTTTILSESRLRTLGRSP
jgi:hypothetical protein